MIVERKLTAEELAAILRVPLESARALAIKNDWRFDRDRRGRLRISVPDQFLKAQANSAGGARGAGKARAGAVFDTPAKPRPSAPKAPAAMAAAKAASSAQTGSSARPAAKPKRPADRREPEGLTDVDLVAGRPLSGAGPTTHVSAGSALPVPEANRRDVFSLQVRVSSLESQIETLLKLALLERQRAEEAITERNHWRELAERLIESLPDGNSWLRRWLH